MVRVPLEAEAIAAFCRAHGIRKLAFFGSVLREDFRPDSDVDVLVDFEPGVALGYIGLAAVEDELSALLGGRRVDIVNPRFLNRRLRQRVLESAEVQYAEG